MIKWLMTLAILFLGAAPACSQEANVYLVKMFGCTNKPFERSQTGFRVLGIQGLVTALHGVADCKQITATSRKGLFLTQHLTIKKTDADHDIVLLSSPELDGSADGGLSVAANVDWESLSSVKAYGHPYGISSLERTLTLRHPPLTALKELLPVDALSILKKRTSPNHLINVLSLQGNLLPGDSGAPILDSNNHVIGVANGGLKQGFVGISWAVPFKDIEWDSSVDSANRLRDLAQLDPHVLFSSAEQPKEDPEDFCSQLSKLVLASDFGFRSILGEPIYGAEALSETSADFKSTIELPGSIKSVVRPGGPVSTIVYVTNSKADVVRRYYSLAAGVKECLSKWEYKESIPTGATVGEVFKFRKECDGPEVEIRYFEEERSFKLQLSVFAPGKYTW